MLSTPIAADGDASASVDIAFEAAAHFGLMPPRSREVARAVAKAVAGWRAVAAKLGIPARQLERMASAFEHGDREAVLRGRQR